MEKLLAIDLLRKANRVAKLALRKSRHPFGAILVDENGEILMEQTNVSGVRHAEATLLLKAEQQLTSEERWPCTLVSTIEPCAMCAGTQYWANVGRLVYGVSEAKLLELTGDDPENPTLSLPCRTVFDAGQKPIEVLGPFPEVEEEILELHRGFWNPG